MISVVLAVVLVLQIITMLAVFGDKAWFDFGKDKKNEKLPTAVVNIDTPYCTMQYPSEWIDYLKIEEPEVSEGYTAVFLCEMNGKKAELFTVRFGATDGKDVVGTINKSDVPVQVAVTAAALDQSAWTKEEWKTVSAMQKAKDKVVESVLSQKDIP